MTRKLFLAALAAAMLASAFAADSKPKTVIHVITIKWKSDATPAQIEQAIKGAEALPSEYSGITRVWTKPIKKQLPDGYDHVIVMEFRARTPSKSTPTALRRRSGTKCTCQPARRALLAISRTSRAARPVPRGLSQEPSRRIGDDQGVGIDPLMPGFKDSSKRRPAS